jgi:hypothetical protein
VDSYCVEPRFQLSMLRLLDEDMLVVDILDDVYVAVLGVDLHDDGFDGGVTIHEYAFFLQYIVSGLFMLSCCGVPTL